MISTAAVRGRLQQVVRYAGTAGVAAVVDISIFAALVASGLHIALAACIGFLAAMCVNYVLTSRFVFDVPLGIRRFAAFMSGASAGFLVNVGATWALAALFAVPPLAAKITAIAIAFLFNFCINALLIFPNSTGNNRNV